MVDVDELLAYWQRRLAAAAQLLAAAEPDVESCKTVVAQLAHPLPTQLAPVSPVQIRYSRGFPPPQPDLGMLRDFIALAAAGAREQLARDDRVPAADVPAAMQVVDLLERLAKYRFNGPRPSELG